MLRWQRLVREVYTCMEYPEQRWCTLMMEEWKTRFDGDMFLAMSMQMLLEAK